MLVWDSPIFTRSVFFSTQCVHSGCNWLQPIQKPLVLEEVFQEFVAHMEENV